MRQGAGHIEDGCGSPRPRSPSPCHPIPEQCCRDNAQGPALVPPAPSRALPDGAAFLQPHSPGADTILQGRSGRKIPRHPPPHHHCPLVFREGLLQPRATSAAPLAPLPAATGRRHCTVGGVWDRQGPPQPLTSGSVVGAAPCCPRRVGWGDGRSPPEPGAPQPKAARPCQQGGPRSQEPLALLEPEQSVLRRTKQNVLKCQGGRGCQTLPAPLQPQGDPFAWPHRDRSSP